MDKLSAFGQIITIVSTILVGLFGAWKIIWVKWGRKYMAAQKAERLNRVKFQEMLQGIPDQLEQIKKQLYPDGGASAIDLLMQVIGKVDNIEIRLDNSVERQKFMLNAANVPFWQSGDKGEYIYISPAMCAMIKRSESELIGFGWVSCITEDDADWVREQWNETIHDKRVFDATWNYNTSGNGKLRVHALAYHTYNKKTGAYMGSYGTLSTPE